MQIRDLTPMQVAYWAGRNHGNDAVGVSSHLYMEFEGACLDTRRLRAALAHLMNRHPILGMRINDADRMIVDEEGGCLDLDVDCCVAFEESELHGFLNEKRRRWTHRRMNLRKENPVAFSLSLLPEGRSRLHVDVDMLAIDPFSARLMMIELASFYCRDASPSIECSPGKVPMFFEWLDRMATDPSMKKKWDDDRSWWKKRLADMPDPISLPSEAMEENGASRRDISTSITAALDKQVSIALKGCARQMGVTMPALLLTVFSLIMAHACKTRDFLIPLPVFWRDGVTSGANGMLGEFANILHVPMSVRDQDSFRAAASRTSDRIMSLLGHRSYPGVLVARDLSRRKGAFRTSPIVFTSGLDMEEGEDLFPEDVRAAFGPMVHSVSQGPGIALDAQVVSMGSCLSFNWDIRLDMMSEGWAKSLLDTYVAILERLARDVAFREASVAELMKEIDARYGDPSGFAHGVPERVDVRAGAGRHEAPLSTLQKAYLLGRGKDMPLGGVAMQDFREYRGRIRLDGVKEALRSAVRRHDVLRTHVDASRLVQWVSTEAALNMDVHDLSALTREAAEETIAACRDEFSHSIVSLDTSPWAVKVFVLSDENPEKDGSREAVVFIKFDALIADGFAISSMIKEVLEGFHPEEGADPGKVQAVMQDSLALPDRDHARDYWSARLSSLSVPIMLPWLKNPDDIRSSRYRRETRTVGREEIRALQKAGARHGLFLNTVLMALGMQTLSCWAEHGDVVVGVPIAPVRRGDENASSFIVVQWRQDGREFVERARSLQNDIHKGVENRAFSGVDLNRLLLRRGMDSRVPLPVVMTNGLAWPTLDDDGPMELVGGCTQTPQTALDIRFTRGKSGCLVIDLDYSVSALEPWMVADMADSIGRAVAEAVGAGLAGMDWQAVTGLPAGAAYVDEITFPRSDRFLSRISRNLFRGHDGAGRVALICGDEHIDYENLGRLVLGATEWMRLHGVGRGSVVAICLPKSVSSVVVTLSCALLGAIWVPVDRSAPDERLRYLLEKCGPSVVVGDSLPHGIEYVTAEEVISCLDRTRVFDAARQLPDPDELSISPETSYCLYTSGTTGTPKCVALNNLATENVIANTLDSWKVSPDDRFISVTPFHHDMSVFDVFGSLAAGASLIMPDAGREKDARHWYDLLLKHRVTIWVSVPTILEMLLIAVGDGGLGAVRLFAQGGDYIKQTTVQRLRGEGASVRLVSLGGPTETTIWSIWHDISSEDEGQIPYGMALPGNAHCILNDAGLICPVGVPGRIHTAGVNLANGYWMDGQLDQTDFVEIHDGRGEVARAFRTGDIGFYRRDGEIIFKERVAGHVKIRGVRVSLPDIESALAKCVGVDRVMVIDMIEEGSRDPVLVVLYVDNPMSSISARNLRLFARSVLPESHVPSRYIRVQDIPMLSNGKPDRGQGRVIARSCSAPGGGREMGETDRIQRHIADAYGEVLGLDRVIGADERLVCLGLLPRHLKRLSALIHAAVGCSLSPLELLHCRCISEVRALARRKHIHERGPRLSEREAM